MDISHTLRESFNEYVRL